MNECDTLPLHKQEICRGHRIDLSLEQVNAYRMKWGLKPLVKLSAQSPASYEQPSLMIRGWNFAAAMARWTLAGMPRRTQNEIDERLAICQACPFLQNDHCTKCGCACVESNRLMNKLSLATEKCPEGKWS